MSCIKEPKLKLRYAIGAGDVLACFLHSRFVSPIIKLLTKKDKPCHSCSMRKSALNVLFPLPVWRIFFKTEFEKNSALAEELKNCGYNVFFDGVKISAIKPQESSQVPTNTSNFSVKITDETDFPRVLHKDDENFFLLKKNQMQDNKTIFVTLLYKQR